MAEENENLEAEEDEGREDAPQPKPKAKPKAAPKPAAKPKPKAKAAPVEPEEDDDEEEDDGVISIPRSEFRKMQEELLGVPDKIQALLGEADRKRLETEAARNNAEKRAKAVKESAEKQVADLTKKLGDMQRAWEQSQTVALQDAVRQTVADSLKGVQFVGKTAEERTAIYDLVHGAVMSKVQGERDEDGRIVVRGVDEGKSAKDQIGEYLKSVKHLIAATHTGGSGAGGADNPGGGEAKDPTSAFFEAARQRIAASQTGQLPAEGDAWDYNQGFGTSFPPGFVPTAQQKN